MATERKYIDFFLELRDLDAQADNFRVAVLPNPDVGETSQAVSVRYGYKELEEGLDELESKRIDPKDLIRLGERLADRLLPAGPVRDLFRDAVKKAGPDGGARLRLVIAAPKLAQLPWEYTYLQLHPGQPDRRNFLVLNPQISLVRYVPLGEAQPSLLMAAPDQLRLVVATANAKGYTKLSLKHEKQVIEKALAGLSVDGVNLDWQPCLEDATAGDLTAALQKKADLFHFAGHGVFEDQDTDPKTGEVVGAGRIVLVKDKDSKEPCLLPAEQLALHLQQAGVRLAVLGACDSGRRDGVSAWTGVAPALVERGIPAVVAMQYKILDAHAVVFSEMFYTALAAGLSVDEAVSAGRLAMLGMSEADGVEWAVPVLYMRAVNGALFPRTAQKQSDTATEIRRVVRQTITTVAKGGKNFGIRAKRVRGSLELIQEVDVVKGENVGLEVDEL